MHYELTSWSSAGPSRFARRLAFFVVASVVSLVLSLTFATYDLGAVLCTGIALFSVLALLAVGIVKKGRKRSLALWVVMAYVFAAVLLMYNYSLVRDHVRWCFLSGGYKATVLAQPPGDQLKRAEWDGWGFAGNDTTVFLVSDPTDSLASATEALPPVRARGLPCEVVGVRRLSPHWYVVLFYTDTYWGQGGCK